LAMDVLKGYRTYIVAAALAIVTGLEAAAIITPQLAGELRGFLAALGLTTIRAAIPK